MTAKENINSNKMTAHTYDNRDGESVKKSISAGSRMKYSRLIGALFLAGFLTYGIGFGLVTSVIDVLDRTLGTAIDEMKIAVVLMVGGPAPPTDRGTGFSSMSGGVLSIDLWTIASRRWSAIVFAMFSTSCSRARTYWWYSSGEVL